MSTGALNTATTAEQLIDVPGRERDPEETPAIEVEGLSKRFRLRQENAVMRFIRRRVEPTGVLGDLDISDEDEDEEPDEDRARQTSLREIWALRNIDLRIKRGEALGIIGPPGSGKTTLLRILARLAAPTEGRIVMHGRVMPLLDTAAKLVQLDQTLQKNVRVIARFFGVPRSVADARYSDILTLASLEDYAHERASALSSLTYKRLPLATVLSLEPDILLMDDAAFGGSDPEFRRRCIQRIEAMRDEGLTLVLVANEPTVVSDLCPESIYLVEGSLVARAPTEHVLSLLSGSVAQGEAETVTLPSAEEPHASAEQEPTPESPPPIERLGFSPHVALVHAEVSPALTPPDTPLLATVRVACTLRRGELRCALVIERSPGEGIRVEQPEVVKLIGAGMHEFTVSIPEGFSRAGEYRGRVEVAVTLPGESSPSELVVWRDAISLRVATASSGPGPAPTGWTARFSPGDDLEQREQFYEYAAGLAQYVGTELRSGGSLLVPTSRGPAWRKLFVRGTRSTVRALDTAVHALAGSGLDPAGRILVDVGAGIGVTSIAALMSQPFSGAIAFEPEPELVRLLHANVHLNELADAITVVPLAASDSARRRTLVAAGERYRLAGPDDRRPGIEVEAVRLDDALDRLGIGAGEVGLLWLNARDHAACVLAGAERLVGAGVPTMVELDVDALSEQDLAAILSASRRWTHFIDLIATAGRGAGQEPDAAPIGDLDELVERIAQPEGRRVAELLFVRLPAAGPVIRSGSDVG